MSPTTAATLLLADARFPAGGHAQSAGVESAVRLGDVGDIVTLERYLHGRLSTTGVVEAAFAAAASAAGCDELDELAIELDARLVAPRSREISRRLGRQMLRASRLAWPSARLDHLARSAGGPHQPIVLGVVNAESGGDAHDAAMLVLHHLAAAVTSSAVRLLALDPMAVLAIQVRALPIIDTLAGNAEEWSTAAAAELPAIGGALTEILAQDHATWDARLFVA